MTVTQEQVCAILPKANKDTVAALIPHLNKYLPEFHIDTAARIGAFIAQTGEESASFHAFKEYDTGKEYEGRKDLGNTEPGDGVKFKGRGLIQITGRSGYKAASHALFGDDRLIEHPEILEQPEYAVKSAAWFWEKVKDLNSVCDHPEDWHKPGQHNYTKLQWMTILINGGLNGFDVREANYTRARKILNY